MFNLQYSVITWRLLRSAKDLEIKHKYNFHQNGQVDFKRISDSDFQNNQTQPSSQYFAMESKPGAIPSSCYTTNTISPVDSGTSSATHEGSSDTQLYLYKQVFIGVIILECLLTILVNPVTIAAIMKLGLASKTATNLFIASLCCADMACAVSFLFHELQTVLSQAGIQGLQVATISWLATGLGAIVFLVSLANVLLIGIDRAFATLRPLTYRYHMSKRRAFGLLAVTWTLMALVTTVPICYKYASIGREGRESIILIATDLFPEGYYQYVITPLTYTALLTNIVIYGRVFVAYMRTMKKVQTETLESSNNVKARRITKMTIIVLGVLLVCWTPIGILGSLKVPDPVKNNSLFHLYQVAYDLSLVLLLIPAFCNNFIYAWHQKDYRKAYAEILHCLDDPAVHPLNLVSLS